MNGKRAIAILIPLFFLFIAIYFPSIHGSMTGYGPKDNPPPETGDWTINETTILKNRSVVITGNITITSSGHLILDNSTVHMNLTEDGEYKITVKGGRLDMVNGSVITSLDRIHRYDMDFTDAGTGSKGTLRDSTIEYCGYAGGTYGPRIRTNMVYVINMTLQHNFRGLEMVPSSGNINKNITDSRFIDNDDMGLYLYHYTGTVDNCTFSHNGNDSSPSPIGIGDEGVCSWYSSPTITNCTFIDNVGEADATANILIVETRGGKLTIKGNTFSGGKRAIAVVKSNVLIEDDEFLDMDESGIALGTSGTFSGDESTWIRHNLFRGNMVGVAISKADDNGGDWYLADIENNTFINEDGAVAVYGPNHTYMNVTHFKVTNNTINSCGGGIIMLWGNPNLQNMTIYNNTGSGNRLGIAINHSFAIFHDNHILGGNSSYVLPSWVERIIGSISGDIWVDNHSLVWSYGDEIRSGNISKSSDFYRYGDLDIYSGLNITDSDVYLEGNMSIENGTLLNATNSRICFNSTHDVDLDIHGYAKIFNTSICGINGTNYSIEYFENSSGYITQSSVDGCGYPVYKGLIIGTSNISLENDRFSNGLVGVVATKSSRFTVLNTSFINMSSSDVLSSDTSHINLLNCSFNESSLSVSDAGEIEVQWFMHVCVMDLDGHPIQGANISIEDNQNGSAELHKVSDMNGTSMWNVVTEYILNDTNKTFYTPHTVYAKKDNISSSNDSFMNSTKWVNVFLNMHLVINPPTNLSAYVNGTNITLKWTDSNSSAVDHYNIYRSTEKGTLGTLVATVDPGVQQWSDTNVVGDGTDYFYTIRAADSNDNEDSNMEQLQKHDQQLSEGLNIISPVLYSSAELTSYNILNGQPNGISGCTKVQRWNASSDAWEQAYLLGSTPKGSDFPILSGYGYFIKVNANTTWTTAGKAILSPLTLTLRKGLNLVAIPYSNINLTAYDLLDGQSNAISGCTKIQRWNASSDAWEQAYLLGSTPKGSDFPILSGYGYFIKVNADTTWTTAGKAILSPLTLNLKQGLNLIGIPYSTSNLTSYDLLDGQANGIPGCTNVQRWNTSSNSWEQAYLFLGSPKGKNFPILPGYGYFIKVNADITWSPQSHENPSNIMHSDNKSISLEYSKEDPSKNSCCVVHMISVMFENLDTAFISVAIGTSPLLLIRVCRKW